VSAAAADPPRPRGRRDPDRRERILDAAADLVGQRGLGGVSVADIGAAAGIVGSGVYRHFDSKAAVVTAMLEEALQRLLDRTEAELATVDDAVEVLALLVRGQVDFALDERLPLQVYHRELHALPDPAQRRLRRSQRLYVEEWVHALREVRADLTDVDARITVHACIGAIQSVTTYDSGQPRDHVEARLRAVADACLGLRPDAPPPEAQEAP